MNQMDNKYYALLKETFPTKEHVITEIINLEAILHLPKGTEHFISDIHGEYQAFDHVLRNGSGSVKEKLAECFENSSVSIADLADLIYYPEEITNKMKAYLSSNQLKDWYQEQILLLIEMIKFSSKKYTRSKVRKALPERFRYIIEELLTETTEAEKKTYVQSILQKIIQLQQACELIEDLSYTIQRLVVDHLHVVGDIYDRGPAPDKIMDRLIDYHSVDIQWGNHDIVWIAAMAGSPISLMNLLRISARYGNLDIIEEGYGTNLRPLIDYSRKYYQPSPNFEPIITDSESTPFTQEERDTLNVVQQATAILQFKLEGQLITRRPEFSMNQRAVLSKIDYDKQTITLDNKVFPLIHFSGPTIDPNHPDNITDEENQLIQQLLHTLQKSERLKRHTDFLIDKGRMYLCYNGNLLIHGCIPLHENGDYKSLRIDNNFFSGKELLDLFDHHVRKSYHTPDEPSDFSTDLLWYLWTGECSSLFGKNAMTTFERYYITDKKTHIEHKNAYYHLRNQEDICQMILQAFHLPKTGHIINGHTPVKEKNGENPIKANGRMLVIDGGFAKAYQKETGIAGYTLLSNSYGLQLVAHQPYQSLDKLIKKRNDPFCSKRLVEVVASRTTVKQTNIGTQLLNEMTDLEFLYTHYDQI